MSKEEVSLEDLDPIFKQAYIQKDKEESSVKKSDAKGEDKRSLVERTKQELNIPVEDRYLFDLLGAYGGKKVAGMLDAGVRRMPEPSASTMRGAGFSTAGLGPANAPRMSPPSPLGGMSMPVAGGPAGPVGGPASLIPTDQMHTRQLQGTTDAGATGRARQTTYNEGTAQQAASRRAQEGVLAKLRQQNVIGQSSDDILSKLPGMTATPSGILAPSSAVYPTAPPTPPAPPQMPPKPGALSQVGGMLKQGAGAVLNAPGVSGALGGLGMAESGQEFMKRQAQSDVPGQVMAGMGVAGGGLAMVPNPMAKALGAALATASPLSLYLYDKVKAIPGAEDMPAPTEAELLAAQKPAFGIYPKPMSRAPLRPRIPEPGTNLPPVEFIR
jgi:hypothetical protein